jgi:pyruvate dehydrogenase E2 component (dihydrolipoamide acetyltransferase)
MVREVILPKLGQTMDDGTIVEWLKEEGNPIQRGEVLFTTESDKATLEVESPAKGFLRKILVREGETVPVLSVVALMTGTPDEDISGYGAPAAAQPQSETKAEAGPAVSGSPEPATGPAKRPGARIFASPRAKRIAREKGVDLALVTGTGPDGRIAEQDVLAYLEALPMEASATEEIAAEAMSAEEGPKATPVAQRLAAQAGLDLRNVSGSGPGGRIGKEDVERAISAAQPEAVLSAPAAAAAAAPPVAEMPMSGIRAVIARRMYASHQATAPVTVTTEADATAFVALREELKARLGGELGFNVGYNDLMIKVVAHALRESPHMNARLEGEVTADTASGVIHQLSPIDVALAVDTDRGLLVPIVRGADRKGIAEIARDVRDLVDRARTGRALPDELTGGTFTITNLGMYEIDAFTPLINLPETAILGVGRIKARPAVVDGQVCVRHMMWLSLTFDHRLVDGAPAARFLQRIKQLVEAPSLLLA